MNRRLLPWFSVILAMCFLVAPVLGLMESAPVTDGLDDGIDYNVFYNEGSQIPAPLIFDAVDAGLTMDGSTLSLQIGFNTPIPGDAPYSVQVAIDSDQSVATGLTSPAWYYGGMGVDYLIEWEFNGVDLTGAMSEYSGGAWLDAGAALAVRSFRQKASL